jgi:hypothetical protein
MSPTARSLMHLRKSGYVADVVERWIAQAGVRKDFLGFADILAFSPHEPGVLAVQATSLSNISSRLAKARSKPELKAWLAAEGRTFEVWGWVLRAGRWQVKRLAVRGEDLQNVVLEAPPRGRKAAKQLELF